jgi:1-deoxy-D-xylulose-5-phosphate synthase
MLEDISIEKLKKLNVLQLEILSNEIRKFIIEEVSKTGGHLGASLGVVELTVALHYCFNSPYDEIIWDIGHQSYAHKILTGRIKNFHTIRSFGGLSGFTNPIESIHDHFFAGHSSTSISLGIGVSSGNKLQKKENFTISVIGDGSISAGMAFEAMNNIDHAHKHFITILNDNDMSISLPTGAISRYLPKLYMSNGYQSIKAVSKKLLANFPQKFFKLCAKMHKAFKGIVSGGNFFEEFGFEYIGPVDGHDVKSLVAIIDIIKKNAKKPVLLHVITQKGKGYQPAESADDKYHGVKPFNIETGIQPKSQGISLSKYVTDFLVNIANDDNLITAITPAMKQGSALEKFANELPSRFFDVGIAEQHAVTFSAGQAKTGLKPFCFIYSTFLQRSYDQIIHDVALQKLPVRFIIDRSGLTGEDGPTHHGIFDVAFLRIIPNIEICNTFLKESIDCAMEIAKTSTNPLFIRIPKENLPENLPETLHKDLSKIKYNPYKITIIQQGSKNLLITSGRMIEFALKMEKFSDYTIIDPFFFKPLDCDLLNYINKAEKIEIWDENSTGGMSSIIIEKCIENGISTKNITIKIIPDTFISHGKNSILLNEECGF